MKNRHGICRGTRLALSLSLIIAVTTHGKPSCASDGLKPLDQSSGASAPRFNPQTIFDVLGLKRIEYPRPGAQDSQRDSTLEDDATKVRPSEHSEMDDEGKRAQAALSIVSFQVSGDPLDNDADPQGRDTESKGQRDGVGLDQQIESVATSSDSQKTEGQLSLTPPAITDESQIEPSDELPESDSSAVNLVEDGSFDLSVSTAVPEDGEEQVVSAPSESETVVGRGEVDALDRVDDRQDAGPLAPGSTGDQTRSPNTLPPVSAAMDEPSKTASIDPWDDPRLFEPADEPLVSTDRATDAKHPRSPYRVQPPITPIDASEPIPGPLPVADKVVAYQAKELIEDGIQLARRGAIYSARARFIRALRLITQAFDAQGGTRYYSESLARGFRALEEVNDFRPKGSRLEADLDLPRIVQSHRTPVLHNSDFRQLTTLVAQQKYHTYAENQLINAAGRDPVAADALFALGKVQGHLSAQRGHSSTAGDAESMSLYQAALTVHPEHHHAANELGVLLARYGQLQDARAVLRHCVRNRTNFPAVWRNLARVHEQLGEVDLARRANSEWESAVPRSGRSAGLTGKPSVQWVDPTTFAKTSGPDSPSSHEDIVATQQRPERQEPALGRSSQKTVLPSAIGQPLSVGQRYGR